MAITKLSDSSITTGDKYISMLAGNGAYLPPSYESIATVTVGSGGSATIEFTSIPATYTHLQLRGLGRNTAGSAGGSNIELQFNTDTATNYSSHYLRGSGSAALVGAYTTSSRIYFIETIARNGNTAGVFGTFVIDILDYANTNKYKTVRGLGGYDDNGSGYILFGSGNWRSTSAISSVKVILEGGDTFAEYSQWALYGIKGA
jgi:hypothetical protein